MKREMEIRRGQLESLRQSREFDAAQSDTLARAQAKAAERPDDVPRVHYTEPETRRCLFGHSVPANQGYSTKAGFVCFSHQASFDND